MWGIDFNLSELLFNIFNYTGTARRAHTTVPVINSTAGFTPLHVGAVREPPMPSDNEIIKKQYHSATGRDLSEPGERRSPLQKPFCTDVERLAVRPNSGQWRTIVSHGK